MPTKNHSVLLVGAGAMAIEYAKVLKALQRNFTVVGRSQNSASIFKQKTGIQPVTGGLNKFLKTFDRQTITAIVAVDGDQLGQTTLELIKKGFKYILVEKPGGLDKDEITLVRKAAKESSANIFIGYNRRFYSSVRKAREIVKQDRGILSFHFEFNEPGYKITELEDSKKIQKQWLLHNSSHVIDLAFFLGGTPKSIFTNASSSFSWHPDGAIFTGFGVSKKGAPFTYHANWRSPGRWGLEFMTKNHRLIFRPTEKLQVQKKNSFELINVELDNGLDIKFKPGIYEEVESFLGNSHGNFCTIEEQFENLKWYSKILKGR